jgi:hypothetical protein
MKLPQKSLTLLFAAALIASNLLFIQSTSAQPWSMQVVTDFRLEYVDHSYDVPPTTTSKTDPYTGEVTTTNYPGYHVENQTWVAIIKNPYDASYYNFRYKGHYQNDTQWSYEPYSPGHYQVHSSSGLPRFLASSSEYTTIELYFLPNISKGAIDVQVQALYGNFSQQHESSMGAMMLGIGEIWNFYFEGQAGDWSSAQTIDYSQLLPSPSPQGTDQPTDQNAATSTTPSAPEFPAIALLPLFAVIPLIAVILMRRYALKTAMRTIKNGSHKTAPTKA